MAVNVTIGESKPQEEKPFPKIMMSYTNGLTVFFIDKGCGFVLNNPDNSREVGYYSETFFMENFTDFNEPLTLQNK
jgi:hypothetical protein